MKEYRYLDTDKQVTAFLQSLRERQVTTVAVDIEGEFNLHHYGEHLCLVQIFDRKESVLIDPQTVRISLIKQFFEDPKTLKIMYDCTGDRTILFRKYGISINGVLDLMPAVELLDFQKKNLGAVLQEVLKVEPKSKKKFQRYNWMKRPVEEDALAYAMEDVKYLFDLKEELIGRIIGNKQLDNYLLRNMEVQTRPVALDALPGIFKKDRFRKLSSEGKALFRKLFDERDGFAEKLDLPPNSVVSNEELFRLSESQMTAGNITFTRRIGRDTADSIRREFSRIITG